LYIDEEEVIEDRHAIDVEERSLKHRNVVSGLKDLDPPAGSTPCTLYPRPIQFRVPAIAAL
jgi:hypothetical protein